MNAPEGDDYGLNAAVAAELRGYRAARQMTMDQLAKEAGISKRQVIRLLHAERDIDVRVIALLCAALKVDPRELMSRAVESVFAHEQNGTR